MKASAALRFYATSSEDLGAIGSPLGNLGTGSASRDPRNPNGADSNRMTIGQAIERCANSGTLKLWITRYQEMLRCQDHIKYAGDAFDENYDFIAAELGNVERSREFETACKELEAELERRGL